MAFIISMTMIIYVILIAWTWHCLGEIEKPKKVAIIFVGMIILYVITVIVFQIAKSGVRYEKIEMQKSVQNMLVFIFTAVNGIIVMPQTGKILDKMQEKEIEKVVFLKRIAIFIVIFMLCLIFEVGYMKDIQEGILRVYEAMK